VLWSKLGDCRRFGRSEQVVRHSGLDVTVDASDRRRAGGHLSRQGPETLRWALYEAAKNSSHGRSPDHGYYAKVKDRHDGKIAAISVARQLADGATTCSGPSTPRWSTPTRPDELLFGQPRRASPTTTSGSRAVSSCHRRAHQHSCWRAFEH
jgi:Transposase IS116/IS110/IS902 family